MIRSASPTRRLIIIHASLLGGILLAGGIVLAIYGSSAHTTVTLFGNKFSSTSACVAMAFIGAVMAIVSIRRVLGSMNKITSGEGGDKSSNNIEKAG